MKFVAIADTHAKHRLIKLPKGDAVVHAGDVSYRGEVHEVEDFLDWFSKLNFEHKIFIAGNHDFFFEKAKAKQIEAMIPPGIHYLNDSGVEIGGINLWGSPITPKFFNWAFNRARGEDIRKHWNLIPPSTQLLITHGPPFGILDQTAREQHVGCKDLLVKVKDVNPKVHLFGHIHEAAGYTNKGATRFVNASQMNENYELINKPVLFEIK